MLRHIRNAITIKNIGNTAAIESTFVAESKNVVYPALSSRSNKYHFGFFNFDIFASASLISFKFLLISS